MKYSRRRLLGVLWLLLLAFLGFLLLRSCGSDRTAAAATNEQRVAYLNSLGWQVEPEPVEYLKRLSMGSLRLDDTLAPGEFRLLTAAEEAQLQR